MAGEEPPRSMPLCSCVVQDLYRRNPDPLSLPRILFPSHNVAAVGSGDSGSFRVLSPSEDSKKLRVTWLCAMQFSGKGAGVVPSPACQTG